MPEFDQANYKRLKTRLTTKQNKLKKALTKAAAGNFEDNDSSVIAAARAVIVEVGQAITEFEKSGYPDSWSNWTRAKDDAELQLRRRGGLMVR